MESLYPYCKHILINLRGFTNRIVLLQMFDSTRLTINLFDMDEYRRIIAVNEANAFDHHQ